MAGSPSLFEQDLPEGFHYRDNVITNAEERALLDAIAHIAFADFEMRGVVARRRVAFFGQSYDRAPTAPFPAFLLPLRAALAEWTPRRRCRTGAHPDASRSATRAGIR